VSKKASATQKFLHDNALAALNVFNGPPLGCEATVVRTPVADGF
jgi:hypothetical protein